MKKQLKKLLLVFGFVAVATMSYAAWVPTTIDCGDGRGTTVLAEGDTMEELLSDIRELTREICK